MTTQRDVRNLVAPIMEKEKDLVLYGRWLVVVPFGHVWPALLLDRSIDPECFSLKMWPLLLGATESGEKQPGHPGRRARWPERTDWRTVEPDFPDELRQMISRDLLPDLRRLSDFDNFANRHEEIFDTGGGAYPLHRILLEAASGRFDEAARWMVEDVFRYAWQMFNEHETGLGHRLAKLGNDLTQQDKSAILRLIHEREAQTVRNMKLDKYWRPTPFPAEERGLV